MIASLRPRPKLTLADMVALALLKPRPFDKPMFEKPVPPNRAQHRKNKKK